jgi:hypothetical protein
MLLLTTLCAFFVEVNTILSLGMGTTLCVMSVEMQARNLTRRTLGPLILDHSRSFYCIPSARKEPSVV